MVFIGTPHQGLGDSSLLSTEGAIYSAIVNAKFQIQDNVLRTMAQDSDVLVEAMHLFHRTLRRQERAPKLFCFYEEVPTKIGKIAGLHDLPAVRKNAAPRSQGLAMRDRKSNIKTRFLKEFVINEKSGTLDTEDKEGLALDHFNINKFEDKDDNCYKCVRNQVFVMAQASKEFMEDVVKGKTQFFVSSPPV